MEDKISFCLFYVQRAIAFVIIVKSLICVVLLSLYSDFHSIKILDRIIAVCFLVDSPIWNSHMNMIYIEILPVLFFHKESIEWGHWYAM
ncbi:hypothetical protein L2E82_39788 [Cichorium intybus]|uniref:Uncharacterized protein n=1 Tax=Cichorium intybus TaxID=13427 RepID=A0ACB9AJ98_CICIN|nr:hypothetical protein L2E82_39788 [Cichorium intybus]